MPHWHPTCVSSLPGRGGARNCLRGDQISQCAPSKQHGGTIEFQSVTGTGAWSYDSEYTYRIDLGLMRGLARFFGNGTSVNEFGAGMGCYTDALRREGIRVRAYEGAPGIANITQGLVRQADLTTTLDTPTRAWSLCLEVAEHIPAEHEARFLANLDAANRQGIVLSWSATTRGTGHINARSGEYVSDAMRKLGYEEDTAASRTLQHAVSTFKWFKPGFERSHGGGVRVWRRRGQQARRLR
jgi:hypothetical protein